MKNDTQLKFLTDADTRRALNVKTAQEGVTVSDVLRVAIADYLAGRYRPKISDKHKDKTVAA